MGIKLPTLNVKLPSGGLGYEKADKIPKEVSLNMMTVADTKVMLSSGTNVNEMLTQVLNRSIVEDFDSNKLYSSDRLYLFFMLRKHSLGEILTSEYQCSSCGQKNALEKTIPDDFNIKFKEDDTFIKEVTLPITKFVVTVKLLTGEDENRLYKRNLKDQNGSLIEGLTIHILKVTSDDAEEAEYPIIRQIVSNLPYKDSFAIQSTIEELEFGLQTTTDELCSSCSASNSVGITIDQNFFRP